MRILYFASWGVTTGALHVTLPKLESYLCVGMKQIKESKRSAVDMNQIPYSGH